MRLQGSQKRVNSRIFGRKVGTSPLRARRLTPAGFACLPNRHEVVSRVLSDMGDDQGGNRNGEVVQRDKGLWIHSAR